MAEDISGKNDSLHLESSRNQEGKSHPQEILPGGTAHKDPLPHWHKSILW